MKYKMKDAYRDMAIALLVILLMLLAFIAGDYLDYREHRSAVIDREMSEMHETYTNMSELLRTVGHQIRDTGNVPEAHKVALQTSFILLYSDMRHIVSWVPKSKEHYDIVATNMHALLETVDDASGTDDATKYYKDLAKFLNSHTSFEVFVDENR